MQPQPKNRALFADDDSRLKLQTIMRLRWIGVFGQLVAVGVVALGLGFELPVGLCLVFIAMSAWLNVYLAVRYPARHRLSASFATLLLAYDILQLSALLYLTGGVDNPFTMLIVAPVTVSAATLPTRNTIALGILAMAATIFMAIWSYPLPWYPGVSQEHPMLYKVGVLAAVAACIPFLGVYAWRLTRESRQMSAALAATELVLAREQKLHALDGLAAAAAHELGTPLSTIVLVASELERQLAKESPHSDDVALLRSQAMRCRSILQKLTRYPSEQDPLHARLSVNEMIHEAAAPYQNSLTVIKMAAGPAPTVVGSEAEREPIGARRPGVIYGLGNIIENAVDFARSEVNIAAEWDWEAVVVTISDDGPGFRSEVIDNLGEPYVTTRRAPSVNRAEKMHVGLGLGFFIAKTLLERSGARITLGNKRAPDHGAIVRITWPRTSFNLNGHEAAAGTAGQTTPGGEILALEGR